MEEESEIEISKIVGDIENYYNSFSDDGFLGYCVSCDSLSYISNTEYWMVSQENEKEEERVSVKGNDLECTVCEAGEDCLFYISQKDMFSLYRIFREKTPEKLVHLIDTWREMNNFPQELDYNFKEGRELASDFEKWDSLKNSEKYEKSINSFIEQYKFDNKNYKNQEKSSKMKKAESKTM